MAKKPVAGAPVPVKNSTPPATPVAKPAPAAAPKPAAAKAPVPAAAPVATAAKPAKAPAPASAPVASTAVRNSPVPKTTRPATPMANSPREVTQADIAKRAYEIWASGQGGSETDNWLRAERELRGL